jgi:multimeric flavodoxin WrbA
MKIVVIKECETRGLQDTFTLDLTERKVKGCTGCWTCWWTTPGRCVHKDLNEFYNHYITADKAVYFSKVSRGFISSNLKSIFDRMLPLYLPYISYDTGESMHVKRYEKYPDIEFYYDGEFEDEDSRQIFVDYVNRVFY